MPIRPAVPSDLPEIASLIRELADYEKMTDEVVWELPELEHGLFGPDPAARVLLAVTADDEVAGMALWFRTFSTFMGRSGIWLEDLYVRPEHRRHGFGLALIEELRTMTEGRVEWVVLDWNTSAQGFYDGLGAAPVPGWIPYRWLPQDAR